LELGGENLGCGNRRNRVRHVEHSGDAAEGRRARAALEVLLMGIAGIAEVHMHVDRAGQHVHPGDINGLLRGWHCVKRADRQNFAVLDRNRSVDHGVGRNDLAALEDQVGRHSAAHPPSTGISAPVIWRETSLAKNRHAFATSLSVVTRRSAYSLACRCAASSTVMFSFFAMSAQTLSRKRGPSTMPGAT